MFSNKGFKTRICNKAVITFDKADFLIKMYSKVSTIDCYSIAKAQI